MNIEQIINDKIGRKQIISIVAMIMLAENLTYVLIIAVLAILIQLFADWKFPRDNVETEKVGEEKV